MFVCVCVCLSVCLSQNVHVSKRVLQFYTVYESSSQVEDTKSIESGQKFKKKSLFCSDFKIGFLRAQKELGVHIWAAFEVITIFLKISKILRGFCRILV